MFVAGHRGMVGAAGRRLAKRIARSSRRIVATSIDAAVGYRALCGRPQAGCRGDRRAEVGASSQTALSVSFWATIAIGLNLIRSRRAGAQLLFLGSSCIIRHTRQPMREDMLLTGRWSRPMSGTPRQDRRDQIMPGIRKQYGADFISAMPTNLYGPGDNYHPEHSHVPAALIRRMHEAKVAGVPTAVIWGTGKPRREFLFVEDLADACVFMLKNYSDVGFLNVGTGADTSIAEFAQTVADVVGFKGKFVFDLSKPDGMPRKLLDVSKLEALGWQARTDLRAGLAAAYAEFQAGGGRVTRAS